MQELTVRLVKKREKLSRKKNVAAYARVSTSKDTMLHSLSAQVSYYSELIQSTSGWLYVGAYVDEGISGTKADRPNFTRLLSDAREGKIDLIITKSISRFARNTITLLETIRELKRLNVDVFFEEQNIHSLSADGELILSFLASYAQEEAKSASDNLKWSIRNGFKKGNAWNTYVFGYEFSKGTFTINEQEARVVERIYHDYLSGLGTPAIAKALNKEGILTKLGWPWRHGGVAYVLRNYLYTGNMLLQSTYKDNFITKRKVLNNGELPRYHAEGSHTPIIDISTFQKVQEMIKAKQNNRKKPANGSLTTNYRGMLVCSQCGKNYRRKVVGNKAYWMCATYNMHGKEACPLRQIPEDILDGLMDSELHLDTINYTNIKKKLKRIDVLPNNTLVFNLKSGEECTIVWEHKSRKASWTPAMKERARKKAKEQHYEKNYCNSVNN